MEKRGPPAPLAREAAALRLLRGHGAAPVLIAHEPGVLVTGRLPGAPRPLRALAAPPLRALGRALRAVHEARAGPAGGLPHWPAPATDLAAYRRGRAEDAARALGPGADAVHARALGVAGAAAPGRRPFRLLHGDLVEANIVWHGDVPALVDWEFWRMGDPAEDLAYLAEVNGLTGAAVAAVLEGYGDATMGCRLDPWRGLAALEAGAWYRAAGHGAAARRLLARGRALRAPAAEDRRG